MRAIVFVKATEDSERGLLPTEEMVPKLDEMGKFNEAMVDAGLLIDGDGLKPSSAGKRIAFDGTGRTVIDGPFAATSELVAGYWIWEVKDLDEAVAWVKRCPNPMPGQSEIEIRPFYEISDFDEAMTPEAEQIYDSMRTSSRAADAVGHRALAWPASPGARPGGKIRPSHSPRKPHIPPAS